MQQHQTKGISDFHKLMVTVVKIFFFLKARSKKKKKRERDRKEKKKVVNFITKELRKTIMNRSTK